MRQYVSVIVDAANSGLLGVDGVIHRASSPKILAECQKIHALQGICRTGEAVITTGGRLPAMHVIHTCRPSLKRRLQRRARITS